MYWAPEMMFEELHEQQHDKNVDWWALGVLIYRMLSGCMPYQGQDRQELSIKTQNEEPTPIVGCNFSKELEDLIQKLLVKSRRQRLGNDAAEEVFSHPFFASLDNMIPILPSP